MSSEKLDSLVENIVKLHEAKKFDELKSHLSKQALQAEGGWFTKEKFDDVCKVIEEKLGNVKTIKCVFNTQRKDTIFTLWKAEYSNFQDDVLWQIVFDQENKIFAMSVDWGEYYFNQES